VSIGLNQYQRAALKTNSEDTILHYQKCPSCSTEVFYHDPKIVDSLILNGQLAKIILKIGEDKLALTPEPGITEVRWVDKKFELLKLETTPEDWWHKCEKEKIVSCKIFH
jgi:hypothetical protein